MKTGIKRKRMIKMKTIHSKQQAMERCIIIFISKKIIKKKESLKFSEKVKESS
jgi:hypothetical protein